MPNLRLGTSDLEEVDFSLLLIMNEVFTIQEMPQVLKPEVRDRIVAAAEVVFAADGFAKATMAGIAKHAGLSTGNVYRYFGGKRDLFEHLLDATFVERFEQLLEARVGALAGVDLRDLPDGAIAADDAMLRFWIDHRLRVVVLLDRAEGSRYASFGDRFVSRLVELASRQLGREADEVVELTLDNVFQTSRRAVVTILERYEDEESIRNAFAAFRSFQLAGLDGFKQWVMSHER